jgi:alpha-glucosidase
MNDFKWWQTAVFYQIYPRSFADGNGDGIGDIQGMIARLDYLKRLGIDGVWLSPHFPSPQWDCGYDISDYCNVEPDYGTLDDFKVFLAEAHRRGIRVILDMVLNHTSDQHAWFIESRSSRESPKRDWYIWRDAKPDGSPPNNWYSTFGGPAWEYDEKTGSYYYHFFFKQQPDLNWRNPEVKQAMFDAMRFWLDMGVDGFRLDAIGTIYEDADLPDQQAGITQEELYKLSQGAKTPEDWKKLEPLWEEMFRFQHDLPGIHELMRDLRSLVNEYQDRVLVGETDDIAFYGNGEDELHLNFNFPLMETKLLTAAWVSENQKMRLGKLPAAAWPCNTLGNHDCPRVYNRFGDGEHNDAIARQNLALLLALKGTPFLYNGEEIGMSDYLITELARFRDQSGVYFYQLATKLSDMPEEEALRLAAMNSRDKNRTPTQWANAANAGFSPAGVTPWLPVNPNYAEGINAADQERDAGSLLNFYRRALHMRRQNPALVTGDYQLLQGDGASPDTPTEGALVFLRTAPEQRCLVALNMTVAPVTVQPGLAVKHARLVFSTHQRTDGALNIKNLELAPYEALIVEIS